MSVITSTLVSILAITGVAYAASIDATSKLGGNSGDDFEFDGTGRFNSVVIGKQAIGVLHSLMEQSLTQQQLTVMTTQ